MFWIRPLRLGQKTSPANKATFCRMHRLCDKHLPICGVLSLGKGALRKRLPFTHLYCINVQTSRKTVPARTEKILAELKAWCTDNSGNAIRGRNVEVAKAAETTRQAVNDWFSGRRNPTAEQILAVQEFLQKERRSRKERG